jgi:hypothetical protein
MPAYPPPNAREALCTALIHEIRSSRPHHLLGVVIAPLRGLPELAIL